MNHILKLSEYSDYKVQHQSIQNNSIRMHRNLNVPQAHTREHTKKPLWIITTAFHLFNSFSLIHLKNKSYILLCPKSLLRNKQHTDIHNFSVLHLVYSLVLF